MLDKSIPYKNIIMKRPAERLEPEGGLASAEREIALPAPSLPSGFSFKFYRPGDSVHWSGIETSVLEFDHVEAAEKYFAKDYLPHEVALRERMIFVVSDSGEYVATSSAWWTEYKGRRQASLHWIAVKPEFQGLGLGGTVVMKALSLFPRVEPGLDVYLHTQTWSHKAVRLYAKLGFRMCKSDTLAHHTNDYAAAMEVLRDVLEVSDYKKLEISAVD